ncbi:MAG: hypothetical protein JWM95_3424 [Gemmatimonadetes bacterium]|nr:hypothetical protein [Gemmatimonadota bacterium]
MQFINTVTPFEQQHFDPASTTVSPHSVDIGGIFGFPLDDEQIKRLSGAPAGSTIDVFHKSAWTADEVGTEAVPPGLYFTVKNATYLFHHNMVGVFHDGSSIVLLDKALENGKV